MSVWDLRPSLRSYGCTEGTRSPVVHASPALGATRTRPGVSCVAPWRSMFTGSPGPYSLDQASDFLAGQARAWGVAKPCTTAAVKGIDSGGHLARWPHARSLFWGTPTPGPALLTPVTPPGARSMSHLASAPSIATEGRHSKRIVGPFQAFISLDQRSFMVQRPLAEAQRSMGQRFGFMGRHVTGHRFVSHRAYAHARPRPFWVARSRAGGRLVAPRASGSGNNGDDAVNRAVQAGDGLAPGGPGGAILGYWSEEAKAKEAAKKEKKEKKDREALERASIEYFRKLMEKVDKPSAMEMVKRLDYTNLLGIDTKSKGVSMAKGSLYDFRYEVKLKHPNKVALVRNGEFYEVQGFDAVLLVQYAGLNPMGTGHPRAGCPRMNLRRTLEDLLDAGLSVAVCEERKDASTWRKKNTQRKVRFVAGIVTPAKRTYLHGTLDEGWDPSFAHKSPPIIGLAASDRGFTLIEIDAEMLKCSYADDLTEEAVMARISSVGWSPPLYLHASMTKASKALWEGSNLQRDFQGEDKRVFGEGGVTHHWQSEIHEQLLNEVRNDLSMDAEVPFTIARTDHLGRPRPLYLSTAKEIGLLPSPGVPSLVDAMLPHDCPIVQRKYLEQFLLNPPPHNVADAVQKACHLLQHVSVPNFACPPAQRLVQLITAKEASHVVFRELARMAADVGALFRTGGASRELAELLMVPTELQAGLLVPHDTLTAKCVELVKTIEAQVGDTSARAAQAQPNADAPSSGVPDLDEFFASNEQSFRGQVLPSVVAKEYKLVADKARALSKAVEEDFLPNLPKFIGPSASSRRTASSAGTSPDDNEEEDDEPEEAEPPPTVMSSSGPFGSKKPTGGSGGTRKAYVAFDVRDNLISINGRKPSASPGVNSTVDWRQFMHPKDRNGKVMTSRFTTKKVDDALVAYVGAVQEAAAAVKDKLRELAGECEKSMREIVTIATFCVVTKSLRMVVEEAVRKGWTAATVLNDADASKDASNDASKNADRSASKDKDVGKGMGRALKIAGMWPYWMDQADNVTVKNGIDMSGMYLLTGANMAGKSTVTRSICAVALLANCGLPVPADRAVVPRYDAFMVRKGSSDSPAYAKSSFAIECSGVATILREATRRSLVLVDEFGKGTEAKAGASLAAGVLEDLDRVGCMGVFATHLHELLDMATDVRRVQEMAMEVVSVTDARTGRTRRRPSWRVIPGRSTESLAFECAEDCGMPERVLARARQVLARHQGGAGANGSSGARPNDQGRKAAMAEEGRGAEPSCGGLEDEMAGGDDETVGGEEAGGGAGEAAGIAVITRTLEDASEVLARVAAEALMELARASTVSEEDVAKELAMLKADIMRDGMQPGVSRYVGRPCVYVLLDYRGRFYCGETDILLERMKNHAAKRGGFDYTFLPLPNAGPLASAGRSSSRRIETLVTQALLREGFPLDSSADARHKHFGDRRAPMGDSSPLDPLAARTEVPLSSAPLSKGSRDPLPVKEPLSSMLPHLESVSAVSNAAFPPFLLGQGGILAKTDEGIGNSQPDGNGAADGELQPEEAPKVTKYRRKSAAALKSPKSSKGDARGGTKRESESTPADVQFVVEKRVAGEVMPASATGLGQGDDTAALWSVLPPDVSLNGHSQGDVYSDSRGQAGWLKPPSATFKELHQGQGNARASSRRRPMKEAGPNDGLSSASDCPF